MQTKTVFEHVFSREYRDIKDKRKLASKIVEIYSLSLRHKRDFLKSNRLVNCYYLSCLFSQLLGFNFILFFSFFPFIIYKDLINAPDDISNCQAVLLFCRARLSDLRPHGT